MTSKNDITGDALRSRMNTKQFEENFDRIFRNKQDQKPEKPEDKGEQVGSTLHESGE